MTGEAQRAVWEAQKRMRERATNVGACKHCGEQIQLVLTGGASRWETSAGGYDCRGQGRPTRQIMDHEPVDLPELADPDEVRAWLSQ